MCSICCKGFQGVHLSQVHQQSSSAPTKQEVHQVSKKCIVRGCSCLNCTNQVEVHQVSKKCIVSSVGALETSAPPARSAPIVLLVHLRQVHPLERYLHPLVAPPAPEVLKMLIL